MTIAAGELRREGIRLFRRLREPGYFLRPLSGEPESIGLFGPRNRWARPVMKLDRTIVEALHRADLLVETAAPDAAGEEDAVLQVSAAGEAWWRRQTGGQEAFQAQHRLMGRATIDEPGRGPVSREVNLGESPLGWLSRRKGPDGRAFLTPAEVEAGERLRRDFTLGRLNARVTADWTGMMAHVDRSRGLPRDGADVPAAALDARRRTENALAAVGPGLGDILVETCCHLTGIEQAERALGWPQRSAKIVLKIALDRLAGHYGLKQGGAPGRKVHVWRREGEGADGASGQSV
ncbi:MAG: DUF6456 domain-containing protein [Parvibaculaceae bacterium]